ncbi:hypothetical protein VO01_16060 (plasmid) [Clavibacter michiganensis subsp. insidiosus]|uniref:Bacterial mobilisation domain-containing protein n=1 Tax=Clavibacter michiganensis subsp. insidiosus TaxID=33014 RepID=A0A0D5CM83_9MICO|nr:hypothetical protein VO01_16060 [Clavibacter michiganensis subsp. insidiosus]
MKMRLVPALMGSARLAWASTACDGVATASELSTAAATAATINRLRIGVLVIGFMADRFARCGGAGTPTEAAHGGYAAPTSPSASRSHSVRIGTDSEWKQAAADLFTVQSLLGNVANNINPLARSANEGRRCPKEAREVTAQCRKLVPQIEAAVRRVAGL